MVDVGFKAAYCEILIQGYSTNLLIEPQLFKANNSSRKSIILCLLNWFILLHIIINVKFTIVKKAIFIISKKKNKTKNNWWAAFDSWGLKQHFCPKTLYKSQQLSRNE